MQRESPLVRIPYFLQCLLHLLNKHAPRVVSDITMMCLLVQFIKPLIRFLFVSTVRQPADRFLQTCSYLQRPCGLLMVQEANPAHKGLSPSRFMTYIPVSQGTHAGHTQAFQRGLDRSLHLKKI
jgi:hypothetical protein